MTSRRDLLQLAAAVGLAGLQKRARGEAPPRTFRLSRVAVDGLANSEDLALIPGSDWIITSGGPGAKGRQARTFFVNTRTREVRSAYPNNCTYTLDRETFGDIAPPEAIRFHGLDVGKEKTGEIVLYQINHRVPGESGHTLGRESIEAFHIELGPHGPSLQWRGAILLPSWTFANDCCVLPEGGVAFTSTTFGGVEGFPMMLSGKSSGQVLEWHDRAGGWSIVEGTDLNAPNGIAVSSNGDYFFICSWAAKKFHRISRRNPHGDRTTIEVGALADNVTWTPDGALLIAGQLSDMSSLMHQNQTGNFDVGFRALRVDPLTMKSAVLLEANPGGCMISTAQLTPQGDIWLGDVGLENQLLLYGS